MKPLVYISSPYTNGDRERNLLVSFDAFTLLQNDGIVLPFSPLTMQAIDDRNPQDYDWWMSYDLSMVEKCNAVLAIDIINDNRSIVKSIGRALEIENATRVGIPVFWNIDELYKWAGVFIGENK